MQSVMMGELYTMFYASDFNTSQSDKIDKKERETSEKAVGKHPRKDKR